MNDLARALRNIPDADDEKPFVQRTVSAADAAPIETTAPSSVFQLASRPIPKRRRASQALVLRDVDQLLAPVPVAREIPPVRFQEAVGLIDSEAE